MAFYFRYPPNLEYVDRTPGNTNISEYDTVKNLFKRLKLREDISGDYLYFTKYFVKGDERPDNIAHKFYDDETLDWLVLLSNNIQNVYDEWPKTEIQFTAYLYAKYETTDKIQSVRHYETRKLQDNNGNVVLKGGLIVPQNFEFTYYDRSLGQNVTNKTSAVAITNYQYEARLESAKRGIYLLKQEYVPVVLQDIEREMPYKEGSTQYVSETLKRAENIRLFA